MTEKENLKKITIKLPNEVLEEARIYADFENISLNNYIVSAIVSAVFTSKKNAENIKPKVGKNLSDAYIRR